MPDPDVMRFSSSIDHLCGAIPSLLRHRSELLSAWWFSLQDKFSIQVIERGLKLLAESWEPKRGMPALANAIECCRKAQKNEELRAHVQEMKALPGPKDASYAHAPCDLGPNDVSAMRALLGRIFDFSEEPMTGRELVSRMITYGDLMAGTEPRWRFMERNGASTSACKKEMASVGLDPQSTKQFEAFWEEEHGKKRMVRQ